MLNWNISETELIWCYAVYTFSSQKIADVSIYFRINQRCFWLTIKQKKPLTLICWRSQIIFSKLIFRLELHWNCRVYRNVFCLIIINRCLIRKKIKCWLIISMKNFISINYSKFSDWVELNNFLENTKLIINKLLCLINSKVSILVNSKFLKVCYLQLGS